MRYEEAVTEVEKFRKDVEKMQSALEALLDGGLRRHAIIILLHHQTKIPQKNINAVLDGLESCVEAYFIVDEEGDY